MFGSRGKWVQRALLAGVLSSLFATQAARADLCMTGPVSLPALSGPPEWDNFGSNPFWRPELHDPRWSGSPIQYLTALPVGGSAIWAQDVAMRAVVVGKIVYVSIQAEADDTGPDAQDFAYVAFTRGNLTGAEAIAIDLRNAGTTISPPAAPSGVTVPTDSPAPQELAFAAVTHYHADHSRGTGTTDWDGGSGGVPTWLKGARWDRPILGSPRWAVTLRIDLSPTGLNIGGATNFFFGATIHNSTGDVVVGNSTPVLSGTNELIGTPINVHADTWPVYQDLGTACPSGITVASNDIGVWTGTPGANLGGALTQQICTGSASCTATVNTFRVIARHVVGAILPWDVRARVRIAGWGTEVVNWDDATWQDVAKVPTGTDILLGSTANLTASNGWVWGQPVPAGDGTSAVTIDYTCTKQGTDSFCPKLADMSELHQCIMAEVSSPSGALVTTPAATQNMNYQTLSSHEREATISLAGVKQWLGEAAVQDRDVYLYIDDHNLPKVMDKPFQLPLADMEKVREMTAHPILLPTLPGKPVRLPPVHPLPPVRPVPGPITGRRLPPQPPVKPYMVDKALVRREQEQATLLLKSTERFATGLPINNTLAMTTEQALDAVWPTYRIRAYFDSGKTFTEHGHTSKALIPMSPFGLRLTHAGSLYGFTHALTGVGGVVLTQINDHWFKIHMKDESVVKVSARIAAVETLAPATPPPSASASAQPPTPPVPPGPAPQPPPPGCGCRVVQPTNGDLGWLVAALGLGVITFTRRRRNRA
ncbi:MAG: hypothetical protein ABI548_02445 [Polyangiaceae bacterium]